MKLAFKWEWHQLQRLFVDQKLEIASVRLREEKKKKTRFALRAANSVLPGGL